MTFDDGIVKIYGVENAAEPGNKPKDKLAYKESYYFGYEKIGLTRHYNAAAVKEKVDEVIHIQQDRSIRAKDVAVMEDGMQCRITFVQHGEDENGIRISILSLERIGEVYGEIEGHT
ncbi:head-tail adaptor protein [Murimonas intestini]|uniref:Head-tail adaptor protein n=1 Tax=Murimonas intestini TaxID=1337051 RepID=A0AB73SZP0_9FIRM|nr:head-tail adaptor protein [Murimonas intestini]MCR1842759.1 head-tail adaptor protein [Murimonas intestini]MCR1867902.1 head-tail adaptor protein [Murimonas intestini]MCR1885254.1 head-tail adaptor protein [Murimonas intestini]